MRTLSKLTALASLAITSYWLVLNIAYAIWYIWAVDPLSLAGRAPYISRVDISAANTIIFFLTAWFVYRGIGRYDAVRKGKLPVNQVWTASFPFPPGFANLLIQLGLLGTIFAFIIAFNRLSGTGLQNQQTILIVPLGAALWSSFAGVLFAFVVLPPIQKIFARLMGIKLQTEDSVHQVANLSDTLSRFGSILSGVTNGLNQMREHTRFINDLLANIGASDLRQTVNTIAQNSGLLAQALPQLVQAQIRLSADLATLTRVAEEQRRESQATRTQLGLLQQALTQQLAAVEEARRAAASLETQVAANSTASHALAARVERCERAIAQLAVSAADLPAAIRDLAPLLREPVALVSATRPSRVRFRLPPINLTKMFTSLLGSGNQDRGGK